MSKYYSLNGSENLNIVYASANDTNMINLFTVFQLFDTLIM